MNKYVYAFKDGNRDMRELLGGKGANLAEMTNIGLPVPSGFTVTTEACNMYYSDGKVLSEEVRKQVLDEISKLEESSGKSFGNGDNPLLVSVRSGSRASMPGMMDTILNLGLNDEVVSKLISKTGNKRFVYDSYRRLIMMYADVVMGYSKNKFERKLDEIKESFGVKNDLELSEDNLEQVVREFKAIYNEVSGTNFPQDPSEQLLMAVKAVFESWNGDRAVYYRKLNDIPSDWGTAVNVQEMVFGNLGENSGTGVAFTRNPANGVNELYGEYLMNAQGEDVVAGVRTPEPISKLKEEMPLIYEEFLKHGKTLENHYKDMQDMEFTIESGKLYMLQTRNGKRTANAAMKIAVDLVNESILTKEEALLTVNPKQLDALLHPAFNDDALKQGEEVAKGLAASPGAATGKIYFDADTVTKKNQDGEKVILVRLETSPEDIEGMNHAEGILTVRGGMTSHAAVVARGMGRSCVTGCGELTINESQKTLTTKDGKVFHEGDFLSIDGSTGIVYAGIIETEEPQISGDFETFMSYADEVRTMNIRANADTSRDALVARKFGAEGIGLCRTEHMFFDEKRIFTFRKMIMSITKEEREKALEELLPYQRSDFESLFEVMAPYNVTIRYLDPPLHEFLPHTKEDIMELANSLGISEVEINERISTLKEVNPMMGHRGCRLTITYPEIAVMQTRAVIEAAINVVKKGFKVVPEIMIPLVTDLNELKYVKDIIVRTADEIINKSEVKLEYEVGTMIETPRAALVAYELAREVNFFSFGTNDLTQMTYGFSRDDAAKFLEDYYTNKIFHNDPFASIDEEGVGHLVKISSDKARQANDLIHLGICGEHGGDPKSIAFCQKVGLDYVSCSPFRVPIARVAAAIAAIEQKRL